MKKVNILITSAGVATAGNVISALRVQKDYQIKIVAVDMDNYAFGLYLADKKYVTPKITDPNFLKTIIDICKKEEINIIFPLLSKENLLFSKNKRLFEKNNIRMAVCDEKTVELFEDKEKSVEFFKKNSIPCPKIYSKETVKNAKFPLFIKPLHGSSSKNTYKIEDKDDLEYALKKVDKPVIQEFLEGQEYTVDVLADNDSEVIVAVPRMRLNVKDGKCMKGKTEKNEKIIHYVKDIVKKGKIIGPANIQCIIVKDKPVFIEVNTRFAAGGLPLAVYAGANIPLLLIKLLLKEKITKKDTDWKEGVYMIRYLTEVFIDK